MIYTLGESLLDIIINTMDDTVVRPGGAMLNTAVSLSRSGIKVSLITELGDDNTSKLIIDFLRKNKTGTEKITQYQNNNTSLALAFLDNNKKPSYTFIKKYPETRTLLHPKQFSSNDILLFGSLYSLDVDIRDNILSIVTLANANNSLIIYDPNIRNAHHLKDKRLLKAVYENIEVSKIIKGSDEDFANIFGTNNTEKQLEAVGEINKDAVVIITLGSDGVLAKAGNKKLRFPAMRTNVTSTVGAGDAFNAGIIYTINSLNLNTGYKLENSLDIILKNGLRFSSVVCSSLDNYIPESFTIK